MCNRNISPDQALQYQHDAVAVALYYLAVNHVGLSLEDFEDTGDLGYAQLRISMRIEEKFVELARIAKYDENWAHTQFERIAN